MRSVKRSKIWALPWLLLLLTVLSVECHYWLEDSIPLSALRWDLFPRAFETADSFAELLMMLESPWSHTVAQGADQVP